MIDPAAVPIAAFDCYSCGLRAEHVTSAFVSDHVAGHAARAARQALLQMRVQVGRRQEGASPPVVHQVPVPSADLLEFDPVRICARCKVMPTHAQFDGPCGTCGGELCVDDCAAKRGVS